MQVVDQLLLDVLDRVPDAVLDELVLQTDGADAE